MPAPATVAPHAWGGTSPTLRAGPSLVLFNRKRCSRHDGGWRGAAEASTLARVTVAIRAPAPVAAFAALYARYRNE